MLLAGTWNPAYPDKTGAAVPWAAPMAAPARGIACGA
jgi:hypothetical protein